MSSLVPAQMIRNFVTCKQMKILPLVQFSTVNLFKGRDGDAFKDMWRRIKKSLSKTPGTGFLKKGTPSDTQQHMPDQTPRQTIFPSQTGTNYQQKRTLMDVRSFKERSVSQQVVNLQLLDLKDTFVSVAALRVDTAENSPIYSTFIFNPSKTGQEQELKYFDEAMTGKPGPLVDEPLLLKDGGKLQDNASSNGNDE